MNDPAITGDLKRDLGNTICDVRLKRGQTVVDVANLAGISRDMLSTIGDAPTAIS